MPTTPTPEPTAPPVLLTTREAADLLRCAPASMALDRVRRRWKIPYVKIGRLIRYDRAAVLRWLADRNPSELVEG